MATGDAARTVTFDADQLRYELRLGDELVGHLDVQDDGTSRTFLHTEVDPAHQGQGLGTALIEGALEDAREHSLHVVPQCPMVAAYLEKHPDAAAG